MHFRILLDPLDVLLVPAPILLHVVGRRERLDRLVDPVVPRHVGDEVADQREGAHRFDRDRLIEVEVGQAGLAGQARAAVDLGAARAALGGLAVPADGESGASCPGSSGGRRGRPCPPRRGRRTRRSGLARQAAAEDPEVRVRHRSSLSARPGARATRPASRQWCRPDVHRAIGARETTQFTLPHCLSSVAGKSSRLWAPRLSVRSRALRVTASEMVSRLRSSKTRFQPGL